MSIAQIAMALILAGFNIMVYDMTGDLNIRQGYRKFCLIAAGITTAFVYLASSFSINLVAVLIIWPLAYLNWHWLVQLYDYLFVNVLKDTTE